MNEAQENPDAGPGDNVERFLPNDSTAPGKARRAVRTALIRWRLPALIDACVLATSELVTNALRHGRPPIGLSFKRRRNDVRLEVHDSNPDLDISPGNDDGSSPAESGRGLDITRTVADESGCEHIPNDGKKVFASWDVKHNPLTEGGGDGRVADEPGEGETPTNPVQPA